MSHVTPRLCGPRHPHLLPEPGLRSPASSVPTLRAPACGSQCNTKPQASSEGTEPMTRNPGSGPGPACCRVRAGTPCGHGFGPPSYRTDRPAPPGGVGHPDNRSRAPEEAGPIPAIVTPVAYAHCGEWLSPLRPAFSLVTEETRIQTGMMTSVCMTCCSVLPPHHVSPLRKAPPPSLRRAQRGRGHAAPGPAIPRPSAFPVSITHYISVSPATQISIWPSSLILIVVNPKGECIIKNLIETNSSHVSPPPKYSFRLDGGLVI